MSCSKFYRKWSAAARKTYRKLRHYEASRPRTDNHLSYRKRVDDFLVPLFPAMVQTV